MPVLARLGHLRASGSFTPSASMTTSPGRSPARSPAEPGRHLHDHRERTRAGEAELHRLLGRDVAHRETRARATALASRRHRSCRTTRRPPGARRARRASRSASLPRITSSYTVSPTSRAKSSRINSCASRTRLPSTAATMSPGRSCARPPDRRTPRCSRARRAGLDPELGRDLGRHVLNADADPRALHAPGLHQLIGRATRQVRRARRSRSPGRAPRSSC